MPHSMGNRRNDWSWDKIDGEISSHALKLRKEGYREYHRKNVKPKLEDREAEIYRILRAYAINGERLNHGKLADLVDLDRKRLRPYTSSLVAKGLIKREKKRHGRYYLSERPYEEPLLMAYLFSNNFAKKVLGKVNELTPLKTQNNELTLALFEFSNRIGAFVTSALIRATSNQYSIGDLQDPKLIDIFVKRWIHVAISNIIPHLVYQFRDFIDKSLDRYFDENPTYAKTWKCLDCNSVGESFKEDISSLESHQKEFGHTRVKWTELQQVYLPRKLAQSKNTSKLLFDEEVTDKLQKAFAEIYPLIDHEFKKIFENLPIEMELFNNFLNRTFSKLKQQELCNHEYGKPRVTLQGYYRKQCIKCNHFKKVRQPLLQR